MLSLVVYHANYLRYVERGLSAGDPLPRLRNLHPHPTSRKRKGRCSAERLNCLDTSAPLPVFFAPDRPSATLALALQRARDELSDKMVRSVRCHGNVFNDLLHNDLLNRLPAC